MPRPPGLALLMSVVVLVSAGLTAIAAPPDSTVTPGRYTIGMFVPGLKRGSAMDPAEAMREFLVQVSTAARRRAPGFVVVIEGGLDLATTPGPDGTLVAEAGVVAAVEGLFVDELFFTRPQPDGRTPDRVRQDRVARARIAAAAGLHVFALEPVQGQQAQLARTLAAAAGVIPVTGRPYRPEDGIGSAPRFTGETAGPIRTLADVRTVLRVADGSAPSDIVVAAAGCNADLVVVPPLRRREPILAAEVQRLRFKQTGARRLVLARIDVTGAAPWQWYWQTPWEEGSPAWIGPGSADDPDRHRVDFWAPAWLDIIAGPGRSYLSGLLQLGYDGVVLAGVDDYRRFGGER